MMGVDYFLIPTMADMGSFQAIQSLQQKIPEWYRNIHRRDVDRDEFGVIKTIPKFLGIFPEKVRIRKKANSDQYEVEKAYERLFRKIYREVRNLQVVLEKTPDSGVEKMATYYQHFTCTGIFDFVGAGLNVQASGRPMADTQYTHRDPNGKRFTSQDEQRKEWVYHGYLELLEKAFSNFSEEHLQLLPPEFRRELAIFHHPNIGINLDAGYLDEVAQTPAPFHLDSEEEQPLNDVQSTSYEDNEIITLLEYYRQKSRTTYGYPLIMQNPISAEKDIVSISLKESQKWIESFQSSVWKQAFVFIPINLGQKDPQGYWENNHWVMLSLTFVRAEEQIPFQLTQVTYFDPLGAVANTQLPPTVKTALDETELEPSSIVVTSARVQDKEYNCGVWVVEHARSIILLKSLPTPGTREIHERRKEHRRILQGELEEIEQISVEDVRPSSSSSFPAEPPSTTSPFVEAEVVDSSSSVQVRQQIRSGQGSSSNAMSLTRICSSPSPIVEDLTEGPHSVSLNLGTRISSDLSPSSQVRAQVNSTAAFFSRVRSQPGRDILSPSGGTRLQPTSSSTTSVLSGSSSLCSSSSSSTQIRSSQPSRTTSSSAQQLSMQTSHSLLPSFERGNRQSRAVSSENASTARDSVPPTSGTKRKRLATNLEDEATIGAPRNSRLENRR